MIPPCIDIVSGLDYGYLAFTNMFACDKWSVPHIMAPFLIAIMTRSPWFGFTMAGIAEIAEYFEYKIVGRFLMFVSNPGGISEDDRLENLAGILLEDWLIQGGIGALILGSVFLFVIPGKPFVTLNEWRKGRFWFYLITGIFMIYSFVFYPLQFGSFYFGVLLYPIIQVTFIGIIYIYNSLFAKEEFQTEFWFTFWFFSLVINFSNLWDYLYSGPIQSWFISTLFLYYLSFRALTKPLNRT